ncbi:Uncharacterised protein [Salmonella bongori]|nr:Uncharacterised protein [Salmonella bongori]
MTTLFEAVYANVSQSLEKAIGAGELSPRGPGVS